MAATETGRRSASTALPLQPTPAPQLRRLKTQRQPKLLALSVALVAAGGLGGTYLITGLSNTHQVLALRHTIHRGETITGDALVIANVGSDPALHPVPASEASAVLNHFAATDLPAGSLMTTDSVSDAPVPAPGFSIVGVALKAEQMPSQPLQPGDKVRLVTIPADQADASSAEPTTVSAVIMSTTTVPDTTTSVVNVSVPRPQAAALAARAAVNRVALVLDSQG